MDSTLSSVILAGVVLFIVWKFIRFYQVRSLLPGYLKQGAVVIDVRTAEEFRSGSRPESLNIPLDQLERRINELDRSQTVILCCASGARSAAAQTILKNKGFANVINAGPWRNTLI